MSKPTSILECINQNTMYIRNLSKTLGMDTDSSVADIESGLASYVQSVITATAINSALAKTDEPTSIQTSKCLYFFANGTPITITEREDGQPGATVTWENGSMDLASNANVFGGRHDDDTLTNTSVTMVGGKLASINGGGLHKSHTVISKVVMTGGCVSDIRGGGCSSLTRDCGCDNGTTWYAGDPEDSPCITEEADITLTSGEAKTLVYGGGEGISFTKKATVNISGDFKAYYVTPGGSNGETVSASLNIAGNPQIKIAQGINRGIVDTISINVEGGTIEKLFAGGEIPFIGTPEKPNGNDPSGKFKKAIVSIDKKASNIGEFSLGGNDYQEIPEDNDYVFVTTK